ncbi:MAG: lipid-A-disaccharide synthase [Bacteroidales bacterium]|nr:lipid-A-disaccharide synthase [Bacteroidales bacterium]
MKIYIIAGEASGDLHASNLIKEMKAVDNSICFRGWGGDLMQNQGMDLVKHYRDLAFMGFVEVLMNIRTISKNLKFCKKDILDFKPDALILIDYPGFNLRIAEFAHKNGIKVFYYISPQVWAWKKSRVKTIKRVVDKMLVILPFEKDFYKKFNYKVDFVGHPLLDVISNETKPTDNKLFYRKNDLPEKPIIALLPGSRKQEISTMLKIMLSICKYFPTYQFVIGGAPSIPFDFYKEFCEKFHVKIIFNQTYDLLKNSTAALVTSGTATLETALIETPQVVCYKGNNISYQIAKRIINIKFISLANLIMDKKIIVELIQSDLNSENLKSELDKILNNLNYREKMLEDYKKLKEKLGGKGASENAAKLILKTL